MTQLEQARAGVITPAMHHVAQVEKIDPELLRIGVADGTIVIPLNKRHTKIS
jgi:phosphomethylpyrimidine synthase